MNIAILVVYQLEGVKMRDNRVLFTIEESDVCNTFLHFLPHDVNGKYSIPVGESCMHLGVFFFFS